MLIELHITNLITIHDIHLDCRSGTTVITGETGAGKSILIDAILLGIGGRGSSDLIRPDQEKCDISLLFDIRARLNAQRWLQEQDIAYPEETCLLRRVLYRDGRSRSYINGTPCTLNGLRDIGEHLIQIHGQHDNQLLLKPDEQRRLLDHYAGHDALLDTVRLHAETWLALQKEKTALQALLNEKEKRAEYLMFQRQEFDALQLTAGEFESLDAEHKQLAHSEELLEQLHLVLNRLSDAENSNISQLLHQSMQSLDKIHAWESRVSPWQASLKEALIHIRDTEDEIRHYLDKTDRDPARLQTIENRLSTLLHVARKYKVAPTELIALHEKIERDYQALESSDTQYAALTDKIKETEAAYYAAAHKLSQSRQKKAAVLTKKLTDVMGELSLPQAVFHIAVTEDPSTIRSHGLDDVVFQIQTNSGQPLQALSKIASGGELSRIALAIHRATASAHATPTLIFDEVDVGIGGGIAERVGQLLRRLGDTHQVFCITHQPQVAAWGHHHVRVQKRHENNTHKTDIELLSLDDRIHELARMLGGVELTHTVMQHAKEMVEKSLCTEHD